MKTLYSRKIGRGAAVLIAVETIIFAFSLLWEVITPTEFAKNLGYIASLLIAATVVLMMDCFYDCSQGSRKIFGLLTLVASIIYAPLCISTYYIQLSIVAFNPLGLSSDVLQAITFIPGSLTFAIDMLGYGFLCLATFAAGFALTEKRDRALKILCFIHGAIALPTFAAPIISGVFRSPGGGANDVGNYVLLFWCIIFVPIAVLFRKYFKKNQIIKSKEIING